MHSRDRGEDHWTRASTLYVISARNLCKKKGDLASVRLLSAYHIDRVSCVRSTFRQTGTAQFKVHMSDFEELRRKEVIEVYCVQ